MTTFETLPVPLLITSNLLGCDVRTNALLQVASLRHSKNQRRPKSPQCAQRPNPPIRFLRHDELHLRRPRQPRPKQLLRRQRLPGRAGMAPKPQRLSGKLPGASNGPRRRGRRRERGHRGLVVEKRHVRHRRAGDAPGF